MEQAIPPLGRPNRTEAGAYFFTYIDKVADGDVRRILEDQRNAALDTLRRISDERSLHRYGPGKWSIREVLAHINDTERLFVFRALWFARGLEPALPSFDENAAASVMAADERSWPSHIDEFTAVREASIAFFNHLPEEAWMRRGTASGVEFTVRALAYITAGHAEHHLRSLQERYSISPGAS